MYQTAQWSVPCRFVSFECSFCPFLRWFFRKRGCESQCVGGADVYTLAAPNALGVGGIFYRVNTHLAYVGARLAVGAFIRVVLQLKKGNLVKRGVDCAERTEVFAKRAIQQNAQKYDETKDAQLPKELSAEKLYKTCIGKREKNP